MRKVLKVLGIILGALALLIVVAVAAIFLVSQSHIDRTYTINPPVPPIPTDAASVEEGGRLATIHGCTGCHEANLGGGVMVDGVPGRIVAPNLTLGKGGVAAGFTDADFVRAIRHGVGKDGKGLLIMPSADFRNMSDADLGKIIAYIKSAPAVDNDLGDSSVGFLFRALIATGAGQIIAAEHIDHNAPVVAPPPGVNAEYGEYLARTCTGCHGQNFAGGSTPGSQPGEPPAANLTPAGVTKDWTEAQFASFMRTGKGPDGREINPQYMPWPSFAKMTDDELKAIWLYLKTLPPVSR